MSVFKIKFRLITVKLNRDHDCSATRARLDWTALTSLLFIPWIKRGVYTSSLGRWTHARLVFWAESSQRPCLMLTCWWPTACCVVRKVNCLFLLLSSNLTNEWSEFITEKLGFWKAPLACELMKLGLSPFRGWGVTSQWRDKILMTGAQLCIRLWRLWRGKVEPWAQLKHRSSEEKPRFQALWVTGRSRLPTHSNKSVGLY